MTDRVRGLLRIADRLLGPDVRSWTSEQRQRARMFVLMLGPFALFFMLLAGYSIAVGFVQGGLAILASTAVVPAYVVYLRRTGHITVVAHVAAVQFNVVLLVLVWWNGGARVPALLIFAVLPMVQLLVMDVRWAFAWCCVVTVELASLYMLDSAGYGHELRFSDSMTLTRVLVVSSMAWLGLGVTAIFHGLAVHARTRVERERDAAVRSDREKALLVADMSHELRTPMNGVIGMLDLVLDGTLGERERERVHVARDSALAFVRLLDSVADIGRLRQGGVALEVAPFSPHTLLDEILKSLTPSATARGLILAHEPTDGVPSALEGDSLRIRQVLTNLITNAIKYTDEGKIRVKSSGRAVGTSFEWIVSVKDTGIGIPEEDADRVFGRFEQTEEGEARKAGTGLGLAIARELVESMGGEMIMSSVVGRGTRFTVRFPLRASSVPEEVPASHSHTHLTPLPVRARVLVVDDDPVNLAVARANLHALGCEVVEAASGELALERADDGPFHLVLMDCHMPGMDGFETTRRLRANAKYASTYIVALTASVNTEARQRCIDSGMDHVLAKPLARPALRDAVIRGLGMSDGEVSEDPAAASTSEGRASASGE